MTKSENADADKTDPTSVKWIAADWGTTNLRVWAMSDQNEVVASRDSANGMSSVAGGQFERVFLEQVNSWLSPDTMPVIACGMVGARQGWMEAPYTEVPCSPVDVANLRQVPTTDKRLQVHVIAGLSQSDPADVMRGEETQLAGLLAQRPSFDGVVCMPGTHTKWVQVRNQRVTRFKTWMTGELFALLKQHSVLSHSVGKGEFELAQFVSAAESMMAGDTPAIAELFGVRAGHLLHDVSTTGSAAKLSAGLICTEVKAMLPDLSSRETVLLGAEYLVELYGAALSAAGVDVTIARGSDLTLAGLCAVRDAMNTQTTRVREQ